MHGACALRFDMADEPNGDFNNGHEGVVGREGTPSGVLSPFAIRPIPLCY